MFASGSAGNVAQPNNMQRILIAVGVTMAALGLLLEYLSIFAKAWMGNSLDEAGLYKHHVYDGLFCGNSEGLLSADSYLISWWDQNMGKTRSPFLDVTPGNPDCLKASVKAMLFIGIIHATAGMILKMAYMIKNDNTQGWMMFIGGILSLLAGVFVLVGVIIYGTGTSGYRGAIDDIVEKMKEKGVKPQEYTRSTDEGKVSKEVEDIYIIGLGWPFILSILAGLLFLGDGAVGVAVFAIGQFKR